MGQTEQTERADKAEIERMVTEAQYILKKKRNRQHSKGVGDPKYITEYKRNGTTGGRNGLYTRREKETLRLQDPKQEGHMAHAGT